MVSGKLRRICILITMIMLAGDLAPVARGGEATLQPVEFGPTFSRLRYKPSQPFSGSIKFATKPQFGKPATLHVELTSHAKLDTTQVFEFVTLGARPVEFSPGSLQWEPPIDSGATKSFDVVFTPSWVGSYDIVLSRAINRDWQNLGRLVLTLDEDGNVLCAAPIEVCGAAAVPLHPYRKASKLILTFPQIPERKNQPSNRDFSASFELLTPPGKGDTTAMEIRLECYRNLYSEVQFVAEHSTNVKIARMPTSWGNAVGVRKDHRYFTDTLSFVLLKDGLSYLDFQVIGRNPQAPRGDHITTDFPLYFLTSPDGGLLFFGDFDPIARFTSTDKSLLGSLTKLPAAGSSEFRIRYTLSKPDFRAAEDSTASDSAETSKNK